MEAIQFPILAISFGIFIDAIVDGFVCFTRKINGMAMGKMAAAYQMNRPELRPRFLKR